MFVTCTGSTARYRSGFVLGPIDVTISDGLTCLVGANGSGKSTLFRLLAGMQSLAGGRINRGDHGGRGLGYLPQSPELPGRATCAEFLNLVAWIQGIPRGRRPEAVQQALAAVGLEDQAGRRIRELSGGMARRVAIAQAMIHDPAILLLDEPTVGLDPVQRLLVRESLQAVGRARVTLVSTHLLEDVRGLADRIIVLDEGKVIFDGTVEEMEALVTDGPAEGQSLLETALASLIRRAA